MIYFLQTTLQVKEDDSVVYQQNVYMILLPTTKMSIIQNLLLILALRFHLIWRIKQQTTSL
jgi:hypothetical protein